MAAETLKKSKFSAFVNQQGKCCYCGFLMWREKPEDFAKTHQISLAQARHFQCTAEHLLARQCGGKDGSSNIAAACALCNRRRHQRAVALDPKPYQAHVQSRLAKGRWHNFAKTMVPNGPAVVL